LSKATSLQPHQDLPFGLFFVFGRERSLLGPFVETSITAPTITELMYLTKNQVKLVVPSVLGTWKGRVSFLGNGVPARITAVNPWAWVTLPWESFQSLGYVTTYVLIPARSHIHIRSVKKTKISTYLGLGPDEAGVVVEGTIPPWVMKPIDVTNIVYKNETRRDDILKLDRKLSYSHETHGRPWLTPALRPTYLDVLR
jgi:hypothetical protein